MSGSSGSSEEQPRADEAKHLEFQFPSTAADARAPVGKHGVTGTSVRVFPVPRSAAELEMRRAWDEALAHAARWTGPGIGPQQPADLRGRTLKIALAMRGGVSLAVWIGGAVAELDLVRALRVFRGRDRVAVALAWDAESDPPPPVVERAARYGLLLARRNYHRVVLDVLAGASAGGLNSVLLAVAQRAGRSVEQALTTWQEAGGFDRLLRREGFGPVESLLQGDEYFAPKVLEQLERFFATPQRGGEPVPIPPHPGLLADEVSIDLSATVINAQDARHPDIRLGRAGFRFATGVDGADIPGTDTSDTDIPGIDTPGTDTPDTDIPGADTPGADTPGAGIPSAGAGEDHRRRERTAALRRLALAARTTSSFPGAFEPSTVCSFAPLPGEPAPEEILDQDPAANAQEAGAQETGAQQTGAQEAGAQKAIDMSAAFLAHRASDSAGPFRVIDGGVFDNIPIERAFEAIGMRGSRVPVRRALFYLDPTPPGPPDPPKRHAERFGDLTSVLLRLLAAKRGENAREDRAELERHLVQSLMREGRYELLATMPVAAAEADAVGEQTRAYARSRASRDRALIASVLADTEAWQLGNDVRPRRTWTADPDRAEKWVERMELEERVNGLPNGPEADLARIARDPVAARETAQWLLECVQWIEMVLRIAAPADTDEEMGAAGADAAPLFPDLREQREELRGRLYDALSTGERLVEARLLAVAEAYSAAPDPADDEAPGPQDAQSPQHVRDEVWWRASPDPELDALWGSLGEHLAELVRLLPSQPDPAPPAAADAPEASGDPEAPGSADSDPTSGLVAQNPGIPGPSPSDRYPAEDWWEQSPWKLLPRIAAPSPDSQPPVHRVAPFFSIIGEPSSRDIPYFSTLDGRWRWEFPEAGDSQLRAALERLRGVHAEMVAQRIVRDREDRDYAEFLAEELGGPFRLPPEAKLAGSLFVMNFGGFLSRDWRTGDWWWGRIDAAATLASELTGTTGADPDFGARLHPAALADLVAQQMPRAAADSSSADSTSADSTSADSTSADSTSADSTSADSSSADSSSAPSNSGADGARARAGTDRSPVDLLTGRQGGLARLSGSYLAATAHRALRVASRSLIGARFPLKAPLAALVHLLAPVLVFLPGIAQVPRLAAAAALTLAGFALARAGTVGGLQAGCFDAIPGGGTAPLCVSDAEAGWAAIAGGLLLAVIAVALLAALLAGAVRASRRWSKLTVISTEALPERRRKEMARRAVVRTLIPVAAMIGTLVGAWLADEAGDGAMTTVWVIAAIALLPAALMSMLRVQDRAPAGARKNSPTFGVIAAVAAAVAVAAPVVEPAAQDVVTGWLHGLGAPAAAAQLLPIGWAVLGLLGAGVALTAGIVGWVGAVWVPLLAVAAAAVLLVPLTRVGEFLANPEAACCSIEAALPWWRWALAVLAWGNALWFLPAWLRLKTKAWSDDSLWRPAARR